MTNDNAQSNQKASERDRSPNKSPPKGTPRLKLQVPTEEQCLSALGQITGMLLTGYMNPNEAGIAIRAYDTMLKHLRQPKTAKLAPAVEQKSMVDAVRSNRSMLNSLAAFLTPEQIDEIVKEIQGDESEAA